MRRGSRIRRRTGRRIVGKQKQNRKKEKMNKKKKKQNKRKKKKTTRNS